MIQQNYEWILSDTCRQLGNCKLECSSQKGGQTAHLRSRAEHLPLASSQHQQVLLIPIQHAEKEEEN